MSECSAFMCVCVMCVPGTLGGQKRAPDPLEFRAVVNLHVGAGKQTQVLSKSWQPLSCVSSPRLGILVWI